MAGSIAFDPTPHVEAPKAEAPVAMSVSPSAQRAPEGPLGERYNGRRRFRSRAGGNVPVFENRLGSVVDGVPQPAFRSLPVTGMV